MNTDTVAETSPDEIVYLTRGVLNDFVADKTRAVIFEDLLRRYLNDDITREQLAVCFQSTLRTVVSPLKRPEEEK